MFLKDEHEEAIEKSKKLITEYNAIEKQFGGLHKENIVIVK